MTAGHLLSVQHPKSSLYFSWGNCLFSKVPCLDGRQHLPPPREVTEPGSEQVICFDQSVLWDPDW